MIADVQNSDFLLDLGPETGLCTWTKDLCTWIKMLVICKASKRTGG
jgi:hypothetical protein